MNITNSLQTFADSIASALPGIIGAIIILIVGWIIAKIIRGLIVKALNKTGINNKMAESGSSTDVCGLVGDLIYYLIMIIVFMVALELLGISAVLAPLENMVAMFLAYIPNIVAAVIIGFIGYVIAKFVSSLVGLAGEFIGSWAEKAGMNDTEKIVDVIQNVVFIIIFLPLLIQAVNALGMQSLSEPLNWILTGFFQILGKVIVAAIILAIFIWIGKFLAGFLTDLLQSLGVDEMAGKLQMDSMIGSGNSLSKVISNILYFFLVYFGIITALGVLDLPQLNHILNVVLGVLGQIAFGLVILVIGNFISVLLSNAVNSGDNSSFIAGVARYATLGLFLAIALRAMGLANGIVQLAFGLTLGSLAVVVALSYGLGGREAAGKHFAEIIQKFKDEDGGSNQSSDSQNRPIGE